MIVHIQVHIFADLKDKQLQTAAVDGCFFSSGPGSLKVLGNGRALAMFDNHAGYAGYRVICDSPFVGERAISASKPVWAGVTWHGSAYLPEIPMTQVIPACVCAC